MTTRFSQPFESAKPFRLAAALCMALGFGTIVWAQISSSESSRTATTKPRRSAPVVVNGAQMPRLHQSMVTSLAPGQNSQVRLEGPARSSSERNGGARSGFTASPSVADFSPPKAPKGKSTFGETSIGRPIQQGESRIPSLSFQAPTKSVRESGKNETSANRVVKPILLPKVHSFPNKQHGAPEDTLQSQPRVAFLGIRPRSGILGVRPRPSMAESENTERIALLQNDDDRLLPEETDDWLLEDREKLLDSVEPLDDMESVIAAERELDLGEELDVDAQLELEVRDDPELALDPSYAEERLPTPQVGLRPPVELDRNGPREMLRGMEAFANPNSAALRSEFENLEAESPSDRELDWEQRALSLTPDERQSGTRQSGQVDPSLAIGSTAGKQLNIEEVNRRIKSDRITGYPNAVALGLSDIVALALQNSKNIHVRRIQPAEELQEVNRQFGQFDWQGFVSGTWAQQSDPVGNVVTQTNLNLNQVRNDNNDVQFGVRKSTLTGGQIELSETLSTRDTNSGLLDPAEQGLAQMKITFAQELLRDGGRDIVLSQALIASLLADQTHAQSFAEISNVLQNVLTQYWDLYQKRGNYFIQLSLMQWAEETLELLESRGRIDAEKNSIEQARALLLEARADLRNAKTEVLISQDQLYRLINAPGIDSNQVEVLPVEEPRLTGRAYVLDQELQQAYTSRAEVAQKLLEIRQAAIEHHVSLNQLLPKLTFSIESSLNGLDADKDFWGAKANVTENDPSYQANINFEIFLGNRAARASNKQAQLALRRLQFEYEDQLEQVRLDVSTAIRGLNGSTSILDQRLKTLRARQEEIEYLRLRRDVIPQQDASPTLLLEQFFQAINRLVLSQQAYIEAISAQQSAHVNLLQAKGVLLNGMEVPSDIAVGVPSLRRAGSTQWHHKQGVVQPIRERVITPGRRHRLPTIR